LKFSVSAKKTTYIKIVVSSKTKIEDFKLLVEKIFNTVSKEQINGFIIQPTFGIAEPPLELLLKLYDVVFPHYDGVRVVPQLHKLIGAP
jgi:7-carboxy-7-deazaguanine synthase